MLNFNMLDPGMEYLVVCQSKKSLIITLKRDGMVFVASLKAIKVVVDCLHTRVFTGDLDLSVLLIHFQHPKLYKK